MIRAGGRESFTVKGPPKGGDGHDSSGVPGMYVVRRVAYKDCSVGRDAQPLEGEKHGCWIRFVTRSFVKPDDGGEVVLEPDVRQAPACYRRGFAGDDPEAVATSHELGEQIRGSGVVTSQAVVVFVLVGTIAREERCYFLLVLGVGAKLGYQRSSYPRDPFVLSWDAPVPALERVSGRAEQKLDRVDQCPVEIEQNSGRTRELRHRGNANAKRWTSGVRHPIPYGKQYS
jgi:hypothetical protein